MLDVTAKVYRRHNRVGLGDIVNMSVNVGKAAEQTAASCQHLNEYFLRKLFNWKLMVFEILCDALVRPITITTHTGLCVL